MVRSADWSVEGDPVERDRAEEDAAGKAAEPSLVAIDEWLEVSTRWTSAVARGGKRALDVAGATIGLLLVLPVLVAVALAVRFDSRGPVLYRHTRVGRNGREFRMLKFRTMEVDADLRLRTLLESDPELAEQWELHRKLIHDPRVTRLGRKLRHLSLDEFPQLINVLRGHMSLVGPRPVTREELDKFGEITPVVLSVRPGMTGLWAVNGRSDTNYDLRVAMEYRYVRDWSFGQDLRILARTIPAMVRARGAH
jgi:exopolysaccharide production protein ExoY